jgi:flavin reductase (DIM6/NTAB) family NADH-FMN oxidoreductase RutF/DNA-binding IclR family transcriptional regulator
MDTRELRNVFGSFVTGVTVVTTRDAEGRDQGVTANSFSSVSLDPPLVLWSQAKTAKSFQAFHEADSFIVNILSEHQRDLSQRFATSSPDKFLGIDVERRHGGLPILQNCCAYVECRKVAMYPGGDHMVYLGEVVAVERHEKRPLAFARGKYMVAFEHETNFVLGQSETPHLAHHDAIRLANASLAELAHRAHATVGLAVWGNRGATIVRWDLASRATGPELRTGIVMSPLNTAVGLLFAAYLPDDMTEPVIQEAIRALDIDAEAQGELMRSHTQQKDQVRRDGLATSTQRTAKGLYGLAVPVFDSTGLVVLSLCAIASPSDDEPRMTALENELKSAARSLSVRLGHRESLEPAAM